MSDLENEEIFDKITTDNGIAYVTKNYPGPVVLEAKVKSRCKCCSNMYEVKRSYHVCEECYPKCVSKEPLKGNPKPKW